MTDKIRRMSRRRSRSRAPKTLIRGDVIFLVIAVLFTTVMAAVFVLNPRTSAPVTPAAPFTAAPVEDFAAADEPALPDVNGMQLAVRQSFAETPDTALRSIGAPSPGDRWFLTGPGVETARVVDGQFVSPDAVTYAVTSAEGRPRTVIVRNVWTGSSGPTFAILAPQPEFDIETWNGVHIQTTTDSINGFLAVPSSEGGPIKVPEIRSGGGLVLEMGVEYETRGDFDWANNAYTITVTRVSDATVIGKSRFGDASLSTRIPEGAVQLMIEPGAGVGYTSVAAYS